MATRQATPAAVGALGADDGWKTVSGGDDGWKTISGPETAPKFSGFGGGKPPAKGKGGATGSFEPLKFGEFTSRDVKENLPKVLEYGGAALAGAGAGELVVGGAEALASGGLAKLGKYGIKAARDAAAAIISGYETKKLVTGLGAGETLGNIAGIIGGIGFAGTLESFLGRETADKIAGDYFEEVYGRKPKTAGEKLQAKGLAQAKVRTEAKAAGPQKPAKEPAAPEPYKSKPLKMPSVPAASGQAGDNSRTKLIGMTGLKAEPGVPVPEEETAAVAAAPKLKPKPAATPATTGAAPVRDPAAGGKHADWRSQGLNSLDSKAIAKTSKVADILKAKGITTPEQVLNLSDAELNQYAREAGYKDGFRGKLVNGQRINHLSRTPDEARADIAELLGGVSK
jgi:hypothetical protein